MRFETRTVGVFEVLSVHLEADQAFDAGRLRQETLRLVEKGTKRIVVDLGSIDYLYSDSINAFVALNRRLLESSGRLGILVPHTKVHEILTRAGLENIMRLYRNEAELLGDSREFMRQSSAWTRPAELLNEASASQILSATALQPRSNSVPDASAKPNQRTPRHRTGPRTELRSRRQGGRRVDQPVQDSPDSPLPPPLPSIGSESSSFQALARESSSFGLHTPSPSERKVGAPPPPQAPFPSAEPSVFQIPQGDPQNDGYSTDAWLLALGTKPSKPLPNEAETGSSSFLPKVPGGPDLRGPETAKPTTPLDPNLQWEEEISLTGAPIAPIEAPVAAPNTPADLLKKALFHDHADAPAARKPAPSAPPLSGSEADATLALPTMVPPTWETKSRSSGPSTAAPPPPKAPSPPAKSSAEEWFGKPAAPQAKSSAEEWFGKPVAASVPTPTPTPSPKPVATPPVASAAAKPSAPQTAPPVRSSAEDWFNHPAPRTIATASDKPSETESWFGKSAATKPLVEPAPSLPESAPKFEASPAAADWFNSPAPAPTSRAAPPPRKVEKSILDTSDDLDIPSRKRRGLGFWVAVFTGILLLLVGGAFWLVGQSGNRSSDVPPVTTPTTSSTPAAPTSPSATPAALTSAPSPPSAKPSSSSTAPAHEGAKSEAKSSPTAAPTPAPAAAAPVVEDHAPVKVFVTSRPSGASVSLDGKSLGTTPCEITIRRAGGLQFALSGYRTLQKAVDPDEVHGTLSVQLLPDGASGASGRIYISSAPSGADIVLNGKNLGKTPKLVELPSGSQRITVKSGVQSQTRTLDIQPGTNPSENFSL
jgi:anti-anti-sigma factor